MVVGRAPLVRVLRALLVRVVRALLVLNVAGDQNSSATHRCARVRVKSDEWQGRLSVVSPTTRSSGRAGARVLDAEQRSADRESTRRKKSSGWTRALALCTRGQEASHLWRRQKTWSNSKVLRAKKTTPHDTGTHGRGTPPAGQLAAHTLLWAGVLNSRTPGAGSRAQRAPEG